MIEVTPFLVFGALAAAAVWVATWLYVRRRRRVAHAIGDPALTARLLGEDLRRVPWPRVALVSLAALALAGALADPRWGAPEAGRVRGVPVVLVLDASTSMLARDVAPDRLERQRAAARALVAQLPGSAVGIVAFAGRAFAIAPPTLDAGAVDLYLDALHPEMVTQSGSSLAAAVRQGLALLVSSGEGPTGALVLISDGDTDEDPTTLRAAADLAARAGVPVHVLGAGTPAGATIPAVDFETGRSAGPLETPDGEPIITRLNEAVLRELAEISGGEYRSLEPEGAARVVAAAIRTRPVEDGTARDPGSERQPRYRLFAGLALLLLAMETAISRRKGART